MREIVCIAPYSKRCHLLLTYFGNQGKYTILNVLLASIQRKQHFKTSQIFLRWFLLLWFKNTFGKFSDVLSGN